MAGAGKARLAGMAPAGGEPADLVADPMAAHGDAAVLAIGGLVGLGLARLLAGHQALAAGPGGNHVQRSTLAAAVVGAPRGLAVDGADLGRRRGWGRRRLAQALDPGGEALREERAVDRVDDDVVEGVVAGDAGLERQQPAQERLMHVPPTTKSAAPASVPHSTRISGSGYSTFQDWRGSSSAEKCSISDRPAIGTPHQT